MLTVQPAVPTDVPALQSIASAAYLPYLSRIGRVPAPVSADYAAPVQPRRGVSGDRQ
jgi:hypothetical protein